MNNAASFFTEHELNALRASRPHLFGINNLENVSEQELRHRNLFASAARPNNGIQFLTDFTRREAGIAFRVSDNPDGQRYGYQVVHGRKFAFKPDEDTPLEYPGELISAKIEYDKNQTSKMPLRETNLFFSIDTNLTAQKGGVNYRGGRSSFISEIERRDVNELARVADILEKTIHNLLNTKDEIINWLQPHHVNQWGDSIKNRIKAQKELALIPWGMSYEQLAQHNLTSRHKAVQFLNKNPGAFRMPKTTSLNDEVQHQIITDTDNFLRDYIVTIQYHTNVGIRQSYRNKSVYTLCANTQVLIQHFMKFQVNLDYWRQEISRDIQQFFAGYGSHGRVDPARQKQIFIRYKMVDNSGFEGFQQWYVAKTAAVDQEVNRAEIPRQPDDEADNGFNPNDSSSDDDPINPPPDEEEDDSDYDNRNQRQISNNIQRRRGRPPVRRNQSIQNVAQRRPPPPSSRAIQSLNQALGRSNQVVRGFRLIGDSTEIVTRSGRVQKPNIRYGRHLLYKP